MGVKVKTFKKLNKALKDSRDLSTIKSKLSAVANWTMAYMKTLQSSNFC